MLTLVEGGVSVESYRLVEAGMDEEAEVMMVSLALVRMYKILGIF